MDVQVISSTVQRFNGVSYYLCGKYFQRRGVRLHRMVWEYHNGKIPQGYHVHHVDEDRSNNAIENLRLMPGNEHVSVHANEQERVDMSRGNIERAREAARRWHARRLGWHITQSLGKKTGRNARCRPTFATFAAGSSRRSTSTARA